MTSYSHISKASQVSQKILDQVSIKISSPLFQLQSILNDSIIQTALNSFGSYINRQLRSGRAIQVPHFGLFAYSAASVSLSGTTNPIDRDKQPREPVFLISKQFIPGRPLRPGLFTSTGIQTLSHAGICSKCPFIIANYLEIALSTPYDKDLIKTSCERVFKTLGEHVLTHGYSSLELPEVGMLIIKGDLAAMEFQEGLRREVKEVLCRSLKERKERLESNLTIKNIKELGEEGIIIEEDAKKWLNDKLNLNVDGLFSGGGIKREVDLKEIKDINRKELDIGLGNKDKDLLFESVSQRNYSRKSIERPIRNNKFSALDLAIKKVKNWLRVKNIKSSDGFFELANAGYGKNANIGSKFSREVLRGALERQGVVITGMELEAFFERLDQNKDGWFDLKDWCDGIIEEEEVLQYIIETVKKHRILPDDLLKRMGLSREKAFINESEARIGLKRLMPDLSDNSLSKGIRVIMSKGPLTPTKLLEAFEYREKGEYFDEDWLNQIFRRLSEKDWESLSKEFERFDKSNQGRLDIAHFKTCLFKTKLDLDLNEINRLSCYLDKDKELMIDYVSFIQKIKKFTNISTLNSSEDLSFIATQINSFLKRYRIPLKELLHTLISLKPKDLIIEDVNNPKNKTFAALLQPHLSQRLDNYEVLIARIDIDRDGSIDFFDLEAFLKRFEYLDPLKSPSSLKPKSESLFPKVPLTEEKFDEVISGLKKVIIDRKMSFYEVFQKLDDNEDGFLTINEFLEGLDRFIRLSRTIKEGLFAYFDNLRIGMIDYPQFLTGLKKPPNSKRRRIFDNWNWQEQVLLKIQAWFHSQGITIEEAFQTMDQDFDGQVNKADLQGFLLKILKIPQDQLTNTNLDRLYKLLDFSKKGFVFKSDLARVLLAFPAGDNDNNGLSWLNSIKQQFAIVLSRNFTDIKQGFERISKHSNRITYKDFQSWVDESGSLLGFNLTEVLLQQFFSFLDPHKKGFLSENDWLNAFKISDISTIRLMEIHSAISFHFRTPQEAFTYFKASSQFNYLTFSQLIKGINGILPSRFPEKELLLLFSQIKLSPETPLLENDFYRLFCPNNTVINEPQEKRPFEFIEAFKRRLKTGNRDLKAEILKKDPENTGLLHIMEFRSLLKGLKMGIEAQELNKMMLLYQKSDKPGYFDYKRLLTRLENTPLETSLNSRTKQRLFTLNQRILDYMVSTKDVFRQYDTQNTGKLTFEQFSIMVSDLCKKSGELPPVYDLLRDLFNYIDMRKDGVLDIHEWMQTFRGLDPNIRSIKVPYKTKDSRYPLIIGKKPFERYDLQERSPLQWEDSHEYDELLGLITRNRRLLQETLESKGFEGKIEKAKAIDIIKGCLGIEGFPDEVLRKLLKFSEKEEEGLVNIRFLMEVLKNRTQAWTSPPRLFRRREYLVSDHLSSSLNLK